MIKSYISVPYVATQKAAHKILIFFFYPCDPMVCLFFNDKGCQFDAVSSLHQKKKLFLYPPLYVIFEVVLGRG